MKRFLSLSLGTLVTSAAMLCLAGDADDTSTAEAKKKDIRVLMAASGSSVEKIRTELVSSLKPTMQGVPDEVWRNLITDAEINALLDSLADIYAKHFTHDDIKGLIAFYRSPIGKTYAETQSKVFKEVAATSAAWGKEYVQTWMTRLEEQGYEHPLSKATKQARRNSCINNLRQLDASKDEHALEFGGGMGDVITEEDVSMYIKGGFSALKCPEGGTYTINVLGEDPTCTIPGHSLTYRDR